MYQSLLLIFFLINISYTALKTIELNGAGASFPEKVYLTWQAAFKAKRSEYVNVKMKYEAEGIYFIYFISYRLLFLSYLNKYKKNLNVVKNFVFHFTFYSQPFLSYDLRSFFSLIFRHSFFPPSGIFPSMLIIT